MLKLLTFCDRENLFGPAAGVLSLLRKIVTHDGRGLPLRYLCLGGGLPLRFMPPYIISL